MLAPGVRVARADGSQSRSRESRLLVILAPVRVTLPVLVAVAR
jgi:hypothetical protein